MRCLPVLIRCTATIALLFAMNGLSYSQMFIRGKVIDIETKQSVSYANLTVTNGGYGTASDQEGNFFMRIEEGARGGKVKVSSIGYITLFMSVDSLSQLSDDDLIVLITPHIQMLSEVIVREKALNPERLVKDAFAAIGKNYRQEPFNFEVYSSMSVRDSSKIHFVRECILKVYRKGYVTDASNHTRIIQTRSSGVNPLGTYDFNKNKKNVFHYWPDFDLVITDLIASGPQKVWTIFNPSIFKKMNFSFNGVSVVDGDTVSIVKYGNKKENYGGFLYISIRDLAIVKHQIGIGKNSLSIVYKKHDGKYYPYALETKRPVHFNPAFTLTHDIFLRSVDTDSVEIIERGRETWFPEDVPYNEDYWEMHYPRKKQIP